MILEEFWGLARTKLPDKERQRIEFFEKILPQLKGTKPVATTHEGIMKELNDQIKAAWPADAAYRPFTLIADPDTEFGWDASQMTAHLNGNVYIFIMNNRSSVFYDKDYLRAGDPNAKAEQDGATQGTPTNPKMPVR